MIRVRRMPTGILATALAVWVSAAWAADAPGDADRGRALFEAKGCARCHRPRAQGPGMGLPLDEIRRPQGTYYLAGRLWNHAPAMFAAFEKEGLKWPDMTREQMADLMAYLQADPARDSTPDRLRGQMVLVRKGCLKCHRLRGEGGSLAIDLSAYHGGYDSAVVWATTIWNHSPRMAERAEQAGLLFPRFTDDEMGDLVEFLRRTAAPR
jgi:cytochrome c551/c552